MQEHKEFVRDLVDYLKKSATLGNERDEVLHTRTGVEESTRSHLQDCH